MTSVTTPEDRFHIETAAIEQAAAALSIEVLAVRPVSRGRTGVYLATTKSDGTTVGFPRGFDTTAVRVTSIHDSIASTRLQQSLVFDLNDQGAPVAAPRHRYPVDTTYGIDVGFWHVLTDRAENFSAHEWGDLTGRLHRAGKTFRVPNARYDPGHVFDARVAKAMSLVENPTHPLYGRVDLVLKFVAALEPAVAHARASAAVAEWCLIHGDNYLGNVMRAGKLHVFNDLERIALGPAAVDLSAVKQGMDHFGWLDETGERFRNAYGPDAPTLREVGPYARIRELSGILITMLFADESAEMEAEMHKRLVAIENPGEGEQWTWVGNPAAMQLPGNSRFL